MREPPHHVPPDPEDRPLWQRLGWMVLIWAASVAVLGVVGFVLRLWLSP